MKTGIYFIKNRIDDKRYIGRTINFDKRYRKSSNDWTRHHNTRLRNAAKKYGNENFDYILVEECDEEIIIEREQWYLDNTRSELKYNISEKSTGGNLGEAVNKQISEAQKKRLENPEVRKKNREVQKIIQNKPEARERQRKAAKKRYENPEERKKASEAAKKRFESPRERKKASEAQNRPEVRKRKSESMKKYYENLKRQHENIDS